mmetsp:Transcript_10500/g.34498  ORF Transcript_10500/g.34498 Transcript_10500/m.34498 type:complete len:232 (-) Transcript_10500:380-1075(-)
MPKSQSSQRTQRTNERSKAPAHLQLRVEREHPLRPPLPGPSHAEEPVFPIRHVLLLHHAAAHRRHSGCLRHRPWVHPFHRRRSRGGGGGQPEHPHPREARQLSAPHRGRVCARLAPVEPQPQSAGQRRPPRARGDELEARVRSCRTALARVQGVRARACAPRANRVRYARPHALLNDSHLGNDLSPLYKALLCRDLVCCATRRGGMRGGCPRSLGCPGQGRRLRRRLRGVS